MPHTRGLVDQEKQEVRLECLAFRANEMPRMIEARMLPTAGHWVGALARTDSDAQLLLFRFISGNVVDDNGGRLWYIFMHRRDGKSVQGAHLRLASLLLTSGFLDFKMPRDPEGARAEMMTELESYPDSWQAKSMLWDLAFRTEPGEATTARIREELDQVFNQHRGNEEAVASLVQFYDRTGQQRRGAEIRKEAVAAHPKGTIAERIRLETVFAEKDPAARAKLLEEFLIDFPQHATVLVTYQSQLAGLYVQANDFVRLDSLMSSPESSPDLHYDVARALMGVAGKIEKAIGFAEGAVRLLRVQDSAARPAYMNRARWEAIRRDKLGMALDLYANGLNGTGRAGKAESALVEAYETTNGDRPDINEHLVATFLRNGKTEKALDICSVCVKKGETTDSLLAYFRRAYVQSKGSDKGFGETLMNLKDIASNAEKQRLSKERLAMPAADFILKGLDGKRLKLSGLKGKIVVLDFWATWCEPCKTSFPYLQQVFEKYRKDERVKILALDTREQVSGAEREMLVQKFIEGNNYSFQVLLDDGYADKCGVSGLPTRFVIDKNGTIQFRTVGFGSGMQMIEELTQQIEILLSEP